MARRPRAEFEITARDRARGVLKGVDRSLQSLTRTATLGARALGGVAGGAGFVELARFTDRYNQLSVRIRTATKDTDDFEKVQAGLLATTILTGGALESTVDTFQALSRVREDIGATNEQMLALTRTVQQLGVIGGTSQEAMANGQRQFNQAIAAGVFRAEEFNSIVENTPELASRIADSLGKTQGQLRQMVIDGKLFSDDVINALLRDAPEISKEFEAIPNNLDRSFNALSTSLGVTFSTLDEHVGLTESLADAIERLARNISVAAGTAGPEMALKEQIADVNDEIVSLIDRVNQFRSSGISLPPERLKAFQSQIAELRAEAAGLQRELAALRNKDLGTVSGTATPVDTKGLEKQKAAEQKVLDFFNDQVVQDLQTRKALELQILREFAVAVQEGEAQLRLDELARIAGFEDEKARLRFEREEESFQARLEGNQRRFEEELAQALGFEDVRHQQLVQAEEEFERQKIAAKYKNNPVAKKAALDLLNFDKKTAKEKTDYVLGQATQLTQGLATTSKAAFNVNKAAASAEAVINIAAGVTRAFRDLPFPAALAAAASVAATGAAQLATIQGTSFGGSSSGFTGGGTGSGVPSLAAENPLREIPVISSDSRNDTQITLRVVGDGEVAGALIEGMAFEIDQGDLQVVRDGSRQAIDLSGG